MAITSTGLNAAISPEYVAPKENLDKTKLNKDDFLQLLLVELQYQDPTEPMDSDKILNQTSQLADLEASKNTTKALEELSKSLSSSQDFSTISAIGKMADLGTDAITYSEGSASNFEIYFPKDVSSGTIDIVDDEGNTVSTINLEVDEESGMLEKGVRQFSWNGLDKVGEPADSGIYHVQSTYTDTDGNIQKTSVGKYPIESVKFKEGNALLKVGSSYVPYAEVSEIY